MGIVKTEVRPARLQTCAPWMDRRVAEVCLNCPRPSGRCSANGCPKYRDAIRTVIEERKKQRFGETGVYIFSGGKRHE